MVRATTPLSASVTMRVAGADRARVYLAQWGMLAWAD
jgi:hypothetical protein